MVVWRGIGRHRQPRLIQNLHHFLGCKYKIPTSAYRTLNQLELGVMCREHSRNGPFSRSIRFCSMWFVLDAPISTASPYSRFSRLWCEIQRSAISAIVRLYFCATASILASALK